MRDKWEAFRFSAFSLIIAGIVGINVIAQEKKQEQSPATTVTNTLIIQTPTATATIAPLPMALPAMPAASFGQVFDYAVMPPGQFGFVQNAAYSGELVSENIQTLSDGNRIIQRSSTLMY